MDAPKVSRHRVQWTSWRHTTVMTFQGGRAGRAEDFIILVLAPSDSSPTRLAASHNNPGANRRRRQHGHVCRFQAAVVELERVCRFGRRSTNDDIILSSRGAGRPHSVPISIKVPLRCTKEERYVTPVPFTAASHL